MTKFQTIREIRKEINKVNREIDERIIHKGSYANLAAYHKALLLQLRRMTSYRGGVFSRMMASIASFTL
jgi:hypothetical protein